MPIANHPKQTCDIVLEVDQDRPESERPVFICRFLTRFEVVTLPDELNRIGEMKDYESCHKALDKFLAIGIVGWRNMPIDFSPDAFDKVLSGAEKFELARLMLVTPRLQEIDRKKSSSPSPSGEGSSAPAVREGCATMSPPPTDPNTSTTPAPGAAA